MRSESRQNNRDASHDYEFAEIEQAREAYQPGLLRITLESANN